MAKEYVGMRLDPELVAKIDAMAEKETRSRTNMIEVLIAEAIKAREKKK